MKLRTMLLLLLTISLWGSCAEEEVTPTESTATTVPLNPNGDSELALLMRELFDEGMEMKAAIERGERPKVSVAYEKLLSAHATEPEKAASPEYKSFATAYIAQMKQLETASAAEAPAIYQNAVNTCLACHTELCPGPRVRIKKLVLEEVE